MLYQRSLEIQHRLDAVLQLIHTGNYSTPMLAKEIGVSIPTISCCLTALRGRGHPIQAEKFENGWRYFLRNDTALESECQPKRPPSKAR
jgi:hypothetical protein